MPWQGHLFIGEPVATRDNVRAIFAKLGRPGLTDEEIDDKEPAIEKTIEVKGKTYHVSVVIGMETDEGALTLPDENEIGDDERTDTYAYVGFHLTNRYAPAIMDRDCQHGRNDPFIIDLDEVAAILKQTRTWWPDAKFFMCDCFF